MKTYTPRILALTSLVLLCSCNSGGNTSSPPAVNSVQSFKDVHQLATVQPNNCITISSFTPSVGAWWVSAGFSIKNTCSTPQSISGVQLLLSANQPLNAGEWSLNNLSYPVWAGTTTSVVNASGNKDVLQITLNTTGVLPANGVATGSFGYNPAGTTLTGLSMSVNGQTTPIANATLQATLNTNSLTNVCSGTTACNIPIKLLGQGGTLYQTVATVTNSNLTNSTLTLTNLLPGSYTLAVSGLPNGVTESSTPSSTVTLTANSTSNVILNFSASAVKAGNVSFTLVNPDSKTFTQSGLPITLQPVTSGSSVVNQAAFGSLTTVSGLAIESYSLQVPGLASASKGEYYSYANSNASITANNTASLGSLAAKSNIATVADTFNINGLVAGDSITFNFTDSINGNSYVFNTESLTSASLATLISTYKFLNGDKVTVNVTLNNKYSPVAPFSFTQGAGTQSFTLNLITAPVITSGTLYFHVNFPATTTSQFGDSMPLAGDNYTDLIMSNYVAGVMLGHLIVENFPGMQFNKDYMYGSLFGQLLQENNATENYISSSNLIDPTAFQIHNVMSAGQGGPYQDNSYANDMVNNESGGHALINYITLQQNLGYTLATAKAQSSQPTPPMFNNKYFGPMIIAYFQLIDLASLEYTEDGQDAGWISSAAPNFPKCMTKLVNIPNSPLDIIMNYAYNQGFQGGLVNTSTTDCVNNSASVFLAKYNNTANEAGTSFNAYPYQVRLYLDEIYNQSGLINQGTVHLAFSMQNLASVFANDFATLSYVNSSGDYIYISQVQANSAFNQALTSLGISSTTVLDLSNVAQRQTIFAIIEAAVTNLETNLGTNFSATSLTQLSATGNK